jgi:hypothetical protein
VHDEVFNICLACLLEEMHQLMYYWLVDANEMSIYVAIFPMRCMIDCDMFNGTSSHLII